MWPRPGDVIADRYHVEGLLGEGGFGAVYAALDVTAPRPVALKFVKPDAGGEYTPRARARFQREIQMVARLRNPHTVALYDYGETPDGLLYMVFERIDGEDLAALLARVGRLAPSAATHVLRQLLASLSEAHTAGLLHRDIKPHNVRVYEWMGDPLTVKLIDFGLARATDGGHPGVTATGEFIGTPRYMAPEQLLDQELTAATDLYCVGLLAFELVMGADSLPANTIGHQFERLQAGHHLSSADLDETDPRLAAVLRRMTAHDPAHRFPTAAAVLRALDEPYVPPAPPHIPPASTEVRAVQRRPAAAVIGGTLAVLSGLLVAATWYISSLVPGPSPVAPVVPPRTASETPSRPPAVLKDPIEPIAVPTHDAGVADVNAGDRCQKPRPFVGRDYLEDGVLASDDDRWLTYIPTDRRRDVRLPLVILLHQQGHDASIFLDKGGFKPIAEREGFILIAPEDPSYNTWEPSAVHTVAIERMRDIAIEQLCVDESRIYLVGHGGGAALGHDVACRGWLKAWASHALPRTRGEYACAPTKPTPYILLYPTKSKYEPLHGGISATGRDRASLKENEATWFERNTCRRRGPKTPHEQAECTAWECDTPFTSCVVQGGHGWPGTPQRAVMYRLKDGDGPEPSDRIPLAEIIWTFFAGLDQ